MAESGFKLGPINAKPVAFCYTIMNRNIGDPILGRMLLLLLVLSPKPKNDPMYRNARNPVILSQFASNANYLIEEKLTHTIESL